MAFEDDRMVRYRISTGGRGSEKAMLVPRRNGTGIAFGYKLSATVARCGGLTVGQNDDAA